MNGLPNAQGPRFHRDGTGRDLLASKDGVEVSVHRTGRLVIHPAEKERAREIADEFYALLARSG